MLTYYIIGIFICTSIIIGILLLQFSNTTKNEFLLYWGVSWIFYSLSLFSLIWSVDKNIDFFMYIKIIFDMYSILCFLFAIYKFSKMKIPGIWIRFSIYLSIWIIINIYLGLNILSTELPMALFYLLITVYICYILLRYWKDYIKTGEKIFYCACFLLWGLLKIYMILAMEYADSILEIYIFEIIYTNLLNVCILLIYLKYINYVKDETEKRFQMIVENAKDCIFYYSFHPFPHFSYITPSIEDITGYAPQFFYNDPRALLNIADKSRLQKLDDIFTSPSVSGDMISDIMKIEQKDGITIWIEINISVIREDKNTLALEGIIRDINEMKELQDDLTTSKKAKELMFSYISHELKTPITSILGYATALDDGTLNDSEEKTAAIKTIAEKSLVLERMIMDLSQLSQLETNQYEFAYEQLRGSELVDYIQNHAVIELRSSGIKYRFSIEREDLKKVYVIADPIRINQVITNLIINAIKYTRANNLITIKSRLDKSSSSLIISVGDKGRGIPKNDLPHIFERFYKTNQSGNDKTKGRGLGLALSKEIVQAHNGTIEARSNYGRGSIFIVTLPLYNEPS